MPPILLRRTLKGSGHATTGIIMPRLLLGGGIGADALYSVIGSQASFGDTPSRSSSSHTPSRRRARCLDRLLTSEVVAETAQVKLSCVQTPKGKFERASATVPVHSRVHFGPP